MSAPINPLLTSETRMRCWCEDECLCGADEANERLTEAEEAYGRELAAQAESEAWRHLQEASA